jgi:thioredoxin 1
MVKELNETTFVDEVLNSKIPVLVDFWAEWCGPCRMLAPIIDELAKEYDQQKIKICKLNVDENPKISAKYGIMAIPTVIIFKNGQPVEQITGVRNKKEYINLINQYIS